MKGLILHGEDSKLTTKKRTDRDRDYFRRHLGAKMFAFISTGPGKALLEAFLQHGLDVRLRDDYLNAYSVGNSLACVQLRGDGVGRLSLSRKYVKGTELSERIPRSRRAATSASKPRSYFEITLDDPGIVAYVRDLPLIKKTAEGYAKPEARWEERCTIANSQGTPMVVLDRQIAKGDDSDGPAPGKKRRGAIRLDMVAALSEPHRGLVAVELKRDTDGRIQHVAKQVLKYVELLDPKGDGL